MSKQLIPFTGKDSVNVLTFIKKRLEAPNPPKFDTLFDEVLCQMSNMGWAVESVPIIRRVYAVVRRQLIDEAINIVDRFETVDEAELKDSRLVKCMGLHFKDGSTLGQEATRTFVVNVPRRKVLRAA